MAYSKNLHRTFCSSSCRCNDMSFRAKLDHVIYAYESVTCFSPRNFKDTGILFKFPCWVKQNKDSRSPERLEEMTFKITACLVKNLARYLFCYNLDDTKIIDYHYDHLVWLRNHLIINYYYPENFADALIPALGPRVPRRIPRGLSILMATEKHHRGPKNVDYPPLEVNVYTGKLTWIAKYPDSTDNFVCVKHAYFNYAKYYKLQCA